MRLHVTAALAAAVLLVAAPTRTARAGYDRTFEAGSLVIPMDLAYQDRGLFQAYGLVFQLLRQGVTVYWVIDDAKTWHDAPCDTAGDECAWDCADEGSGPCAYPTASPDFFVGSTVVWDDAGAMAAGTTITSHGYRGGPFVIDAADTVTARAIIDAWNDPALWDSNPWAQRTISGVVTVHETTASFDGWVRKEMIAAPSIAVFSDGNEDVATGYLRAAGIPQSSGDEFPTGQCRAGECGPGTSNPDMLTVESIMGDMGTCDAPNLDHSNGSLFTDDGVPAFCQIMSMHWGVNDRETVECDGGGCPDTAAECAGETFTYHGHEVVAEVRAFLGFPTHFFAECQAVNAYENTVPNPEWPYLDDEGRNGHFLTTTGTPPDCPCTDGDFECVTGGCAGRDCCLPRDVKEQGAGFLIAAQPEEDMLQILRPEIPYNQMDGFFGTVGGSEPAYNLSTYLGTGYIGGADVTFITGPAGPGDQDVWMTGFVDGICDIGFDEFMRPGECTLGKVSYLGGHRYGTGVPLSSNRDSQGTRLFLNALFEADCVTTAGQPALGLTIEAPAGTRVDSSVLPADAPITATYSNTGAGAALDATLTLTAPSGLEIVSFDSGGAVAGSAVSWDLGSIGPTGAVAPPASGTRAFTLRFAAEGDYELMATLTYRVGVTDMTATRTITITVGAAPPGTDGGGTGPDGGAGSDGGTAGGGDGGCGCRAVSGEGGGLPTLLLLLGALLLVRRRRLRTGRRRVPRSAGSRRARRALMCGLLLTSLCALGCSSGDACRFEPDRCGGGLGAICVDDGDCGSGNCCTEESNCGGGMCTQSCRDDLDCPSHMACEHNICFFRCEFDEDCAVGQSCEHGDTVCEWP